MTPEGLGAGYPGAPQCLQPGALHLFHFMPRKIAFCLDLALGLCTQPQIVTMIDMPHTVWLQRSGPCRFNSCPRNLQHRRPFFPDRLNAVQGSWCSRSWSFPPVCWGYGAFTVKIDAYLDQKTQKAAGARDNKLAVIAMCVDVGVIALVPFSWENLERH